MSPELWVAIIAQTVIIIGALWAASVRTERRFTSLETRVQHLENIENERGDDLDRLEAQVQGISRAVARLEGAHSTCPWIAGQAPPQPPGDIT